MRSLAGLVSVVESQQEGALTQSLTMHWRTFVGSKIGATDGTSGTPSRGETTNGSCRDTMWRTAWTWTARWVPMVRVVWKRGPGSVNGNSALRDEYGIRWTRNTDLQGARGVAGTRGWREGGVWGCIMVRGRRGRSGVSHRAFNHPSSQAVPTVERE